MNSPRKNLDNYFDAFRATERMSEEQAWAILDRESQPEPVAPPVETDDQKRKKRMIYLALGVIALIGSVMLITLPVEEQTPHKKEVSRQSMAPSGNSGTKEKQVEQASPPAPPVSRYMETYRSRKVATAANRSHRIPSQQATTVTPPSDSTTVHRISMKPPTNSDPPTPIIQGPIEMSGVRVLDLTPEEMIAFGMVPDEFGAGMFIRGDSGRTRFSRFGSQLNEMWADTTPPPTWPAPVLVEGPMIVTRRDGGLRMSFVNDNIVPAELHRRMREAPRGSDEEMQAFALYRKLVSEHIQALTPTLIPILIRTGSGPDHPSEKNLVLWFQPTPEAIAKLPATIRNRISQEVSAANAVARGESTYEQALRSGLTPTLDLIRSTSGGITRTTLQQDSGSFELQVAIKEPRSLRVELYDIEGRRLDQLQPVREFPFGDHSIRFEIAKRHAGFYLIVLSSDQQERAVHRIFLKD